MAVYREATIKKVYIESNCPHTARLKITAGLKAYMDMILSAGRKEYLDRTKEKIR
jgi:hypothetical protein